MKKEPTIKNVLKELEHIEARVLSLSTVISKQNDELKYGTVNLISMLGNIFLNLDRAQDEIKSWINSKMLKD